MVRCIHIENKRTIFVGENQKNELSKGKRRRLDNFTVGIICNN